MGALYSVEQWREIINLMDEDELSIWMIDSENFLHYVEVPHGFTLDQANAHHRDNVLRTLLDALRSLPATPVRQRLIDELAGIYFKGEATQERSEAS